MAKQWYERRTIRRKTYANFMAVYTAVITEKGYDRTEAEAITHRMFDNLEADNRYDIWRAFSLLLTADDFRKEYGGN